MNTYMLYGTKMIENDATVNDFASCIYSSIPMETSTEDPEERRDYILEMMEKILEDDISRTDIDYERLLYKYRKELGDLFYRMWDRGYTIPTMEFLGEGAKQFFNDIVYYYIVVHYEEFAEGKI
ncbi:MAG: hypothetical protein K2N51_09665 [Lachnospiraceae bacterium]|nr:hypothetical protein [Lachnospiraceae bacterium]